MEWQIKDQEPSHPEEIQAHFLRERGKPPGYQLGWAAGQGLLALLLKSNHCFLWCPKVKASAGGQAKGIGLHSLMVLVLSWKDGTGLCSQDYSPSLYAALKCSQHRRAAEKAPNDQRSRASMTEGPVFLFHIRSLPLYCRNRLLPSSSSGLVKAGPWLQGGVPSRARRKNAIHERGRGLQL